MAKDGWNSDEITMDNYFTYTEGTFTRLRHGLGITACLNPKDPDSQGNHYNPRYIIDCHLTSSLHTATIRRLMFSTPINMVYYNTLYPIIQISNQRQGWGLYEDRE